MQPVPFEPGDRGATETEPTRAVRHHEGPRCAPAQVIESLATVVMELEMSHSHIVQSSSKAQPSDGLDSCKEDEEKKEMGLQ